MNIFYEALPHAVKVDGQKYEIITDFREWIRFIDLFKSEELTDAEKGYCAFQWFEQKRPGFHESREALGALVDFLTLKELEGPKAVENTGESLKQVFSYDWDARYIISGFKQCYNIDLLEIEYLHWWKFKMLFDGLDEKTEIKQRIMYRSIDLNGVQDKKERERIRKIQRRIALPSGTLTDGEIGNAFM